MAVNFKPGTITELSSTHRWGRGHPGVDFNPQNCWETSLCLHTRRRVLPHSISNRRSLSQRCTSVIEADAGSPLLGAIESSVSSPSQMEERFSAELEVAVRAVHMACALCKRVQDNLISRKGSIVQSKGDNSPVTIADWSVQALISWILSQYFGSEHVLIVAEEDTDSLSKPESRHLLESVVKTVNECLAQAPYLGMDIPKTPLDEAQILEAISRCNSKGGPRGRFWVLDPVDGTLGFVRGDQYAIALALVEDGEVVLGVLGCPNYPLRKEWLGYDHRYFRILSKMNPPDPESWDKGFVLYARKGGGKAWMQPLLPGQQHMSENLVGPNSSILIRVSGVEDPAFATFCEPVEKANSSHSFTAGLAHSVGVRNQPLRVYSMVKYAAVARGDAEIFMKFARAGYKEKIWDHAAGVLIILEAGGVVTDAGGRPLDFSKGVFLEGLDRGIVACCGPQLHSKIIKAIDASWNSSCL